MDTKKFDLAMTILKFATAIVGAIVCFWVWITSPGADATELVKQDYENSTQMSLMIFYTFGIIIAAVAAILIFFIFQLITNTKKTGMSIIGVVAAFVFYMILRLIGTSDTNESLGLAPDKYVDAGTMNGISAGLWTVLIGIAAGFLLAVLGPFILGKYRK